MKQLLKKSGYKNFAMLFMVSFMQIIAYAQDSTKTVKTTTTHTSTTWYTQPWVWIVGGVVLLIILVSLFRGGSNNTSTSETTRTTVIKTDKDY